MQAAKDPIEGRAMERMWSPWRAQHLERMTIHSTARQETASLFARLAVEDRDEENLILWRGQTVFVLLNLYPYNNGHLMILPYRAVDQYEDLTPEEQAEIAHTTARCIRWLKHALHPDGFNLGMNLGRSGGAGIPEHLHLHIVPRWQADTNFMTTTSETRILPESLQDTWRKLRAAVETLG
jgi:ATP adenylyltransferase